MKRAVLSAVVATAALAMALPPAEAAVATAGAAQLATDSASLVDVVRRDRGFRGFKGHASRGHFYRFSGPRFSRSYHFRRPFRHRHVRRFRGPRFAIYASPFWWYGGHYRRCGWLRARAIATGSPYWWRRYRICRRYY